MSSNDMAVLGRYTQRFEREGTSMFIRTFDDATLVHEHECKNTPLAVPNEVHGIAETILAQLALGLVGSETNPLTGRVRKTNAPLPIILASCAVGATISASDTGTLRPVARIPVKAGNISGGETLRLLAQIDYSGTAGGRGWSLAVCDPGASTGVVVAQQFPGSTVLYTSVDVALHIDSARKSVKFSAATVPTSGISFGQSTSAAFSAAVDFTVDKDIVLMLMPQLGDRATLRGISLELIPTTYADTLNAIVCYGDSLTAGTGSTAGNDYPNVLSRLSAKLIRNEGVGGETAQQISARCVANVNSVGALPAIFQMGRNNVGQANFQADVLAALASAIASLGHSKFLIGSVTPASNETIGTTNRTAIVACNAAIAAAYPTHYVDTLTALATEAGEIPAASYSDTVHLTDAGYLILAQTYSAAVTAKGW